jgi:hypothetical protein
MRNYIFYTIAASLLAVWAMKTYIDQTAGRAINLLPVFAIAIIFYSLITASPAAYKRRRFRP